VSVLTAIHRRECSGCTRLRNSKWLLLLLGEALRAGAGFHILLMCIASHLLLLRTERSEKWVCGWFLFGTLPITTAFFAFNAASSSNVSTRSKHHERGHRVLNGAVRDEVHLRGLPGCLVTERAVPLPLPLKTTNAPISFVGVLFFIFVPNLVQV